MRFYHGSGKPGYFEGWYLKQQSADETLAFIPAFHRDMDGRASASLQVVTKERAFHIDFPAQVFYARRNCFFVRIGDCIFQRQGCIINVKDGELQAEGVLRFGPFLQTPYDIMGPFRHVPLMQCRHSLFSLHHTVDGSVSVNGRIYDFTSADGYMEGDRGASFPRRYLWTHCRHEGVSLMLSVAEIPFAGTSFVGCLGFVYHKGREYRIGSYCGVRLLRVEPEEIVLKQGALRLTITLLEGQSHPLRAPKKGSMAGMIRECPVCRVRYTCSLRDRPLFDFESGQASYENHWE